MKKIIRSKVGGREVCLVEKGEEYSPTIPSFYEEELGELEKLVDDYKELERILNVKEVFAPCTIIVPLLFLFFFFLLFPPVSYGGTYGVRVEWGDVNTQEEGFVVERKTGASGEWGRIGTTPRNIVVYVDREVVRGEMYCYRIYAYLASYTSPYSPEGCTVALSPPTSVNVTGIIGE